MNTLKTSKVLALVVALAMVLAVVPGFVASAAGEPIAADEFFGWNFTAGAKRVGDYGNYEGAEAAIAQWNADRVAFATFTVGDVTVEEGQSLKATLAMKALGNNGSGGNTVGTVFAVTGVDSTSNDAMKAARATKVKVGTINYTFTDDSSWIDVAGTIVIPAEAIVDGKVAFMISNRPEDDANSGGIATLKTATLTLENAVAPATVTVQYVAGDKVVNASVYTVDGLMSGDEFTPVVYDVYTSDAEAVYTVGAPEAITLDAGENVAKVPVTVYKTIASKVEIANPSFEEGFEGVLTAEGETISDETRYEIVTDNVTDGEKALWTKDVSGDTQIHTAWTVEGGKKYAVTFDAMATKGTAQYAWAYADAAEGGKYTTSAEYVQNGDYGHVRLLNGQFLSKTLVIETADDQNVIGFAGAWFNDAAPVWDNFAVYELANLDDDIDYSIVYTIDGTADGEVLATEEGLEGTVGDEITIAEGKIGEFLIGTTVYTNAEATITLEAGKNTYYVGAKVVAEAVSVPESVAAVDVIDGAELVLPETVNVNFSDDKARALPVEWTYTLPEGVDTLVKVEATGTVEGVAGTVAATINVFPADTLTVTNSGTSRGEVDFDKAYNGAVTVSFDLVPLKTGVDSTITIGQNHDTFGGAGDAISLQYGKNNGFNVRTWSEDKKTGTHVINNVWLNTYEVYTVVVTTNVNEQTYDIAIYDADGEPVEGASATGVTYRGAGVTAITGLTAYDNAGNQNTLRIFNLKYEGVTAEAAELGFTEDDELTINFAVSGKGTATITSNAAEEAVKTVEVDGDAVIAVKAANANVTYTVTLADADGKVLATSSAALYPLVVADLAANLEAYAAAGEIARVDAAVKAINEGGFVVDANDLLKNIADVTTADGVTTIKIKDDLYKLGLGFKAGAKAGIIGNVNAVEVEGQEIKIDADGNVTLNGVVLFSLESVEIEFVATEVAESAADGADAELDFIPEL